MHLKPLERPACSLELPMLTTELREARGNYGTQLISIALLLKKG